ncbi:hypothetical protein BASA60_006990 [Batrachochytrium salamandrivorans]|nr:hypothetical protein BASA60_006990 [Batrachochytrium salamandrivorans]
MKLSSFFVAAMVITSVNAGRFSKLVRNIGIFRLTRSSATSSATSSVTSSVTFSLEPSPSPSPLLSEVDECLNDFVKFETEYLDKYTHLPDDASILSSEDVQGIVKSIKDDLKSII